MINLIIWIIWLVVLLLLCAMQSPRILLTPQFGFIGCFIPQAIYALFYVQKWHLNFSLFTMVVLMSGTGIFVFVSFAVSSFYKNLKGFKLDSSKNILNESQYKSPQIYIERWKFIALTIVQTAVALLVMNYISSNVSGGTFADKLVIINNSNKFGNIEDIFGLPKMLAWVRTFCMASSYIYTYLLLHSIIHKYRQHRLLLTINIFTSVLLMIWIAGRFPVLELLVAAIVQAFFIIGENNGWKRQVNAKTIMRVIGIVFVALLSFRSLGALIGRAGLVDTSDYISIYLSAELKNLDIYVRNGEFGCNFTEWATLKVLINDIGRRLNIPSWIHTFAQPMQHVDGLPLGNVYTLFYWFLYDAGYIGLFIFTTVFAIIEQILFYRALKYGHKKEISLSMLLYSYMYYSVVFSFFCERFYFSLFNSSIIQILIFWWSLRRFLTKVKIKRSKNNIFVHL